MDYSTLGRTGLAVSTIALDARSLGCATRWRADIGRARALDFVRRSADTGCNLVITSPGSDQGEGERRAGAGVQADRDHWVVCTTAQPGHPGSVVGQIDGSLRRLAVDRIDLYLITDHEDFDPRTADDLELAREQGKIGAWGLAEPAVPAMQQWCAAGAGAVVLTQSLRCHPAAQLETARSQGTGVVACCAQSMHPRATRRSDPMYRRWLTASEDLATFTVRYLRSLQSAHAIAVDATVREQLDRALAAVAKRALDVGTLQELDRVRETSHGIGRRLRSRLRHLAGQMVRVDG